MNDKKNENKFGLFASATVLSVCLNLSLLYGSYYSYQKSKEFGAVNKCQVTLQQQADFSDARAGILVFLLLGLCSCFLTHHFIKNASLEFRKKR